MSEGRFAALADFSYRQKGSRWLLKRHRFAVVVSSASSLLFICISTDAFFHHEKLVMATFLGLFGTTWLFCTWRFRNYIDLADRTFVAQRPFSRTVVPFGKVRVVRAVHHSINNRFQGIYYEIETEETGKRPKPMRISKHFPTENPAFEATVRQLLRS